MRFLALRKTLDVSSAAGRTIKAIRTLARALGQRVGTSVDVEVVG